MTLDTRHQQPHPGTASTMPQSTVPPWPPQGPPPGPTAQPPRPASGRRRLAELSLVALLSAGLASGGTYAAVHAGAPAAPATPVASAPVVQPGPVTQADASAPDWSATAGAVSPSVVSITVSGPQGSGEGSGVLIDPSGHVLTNNHVATGGGSGAQLRVTLADGRSYAAQIVGADASTDLAVLRITDPPGDLTPIRFGDSESLKVGDPVMAVGNPLGLAGTVTTGIVSALDRPVSAGGSGARGSTAEPSVTNAIQTSAAINPGNSGGALVNASGQLVGINSAIATLGSGSGQSGNIGIGFAIPANTARMIADQLIATGSAQHAYLGVSSADGTTTVAGADRNAALLRSVAAGTPAAQAGLQEGDAVIALGSQRIDSSLGLVAAVREQRVGSTATVTVVRNGQQQDVQVTFAARPAQG